MFNLSLNLPSVIEPVLSGTMAVLTNPKHEAFARGLAANMTADEAYQKAGYEASRANASRLSANESIKARVLELQEKAELRFSMTRGEWLESFARVATKAEAAGDFAACVGALRQIGLALPQWYAPEKSEVDVRHSVSPAVEEAITALLR